MRFATRTLGTEEKPYLTTPWEWCNQPCDLSQVTWHEDDKPFWGYWDTNMDFRTGYDSPADDHIVRGFREYAVERAPGEWWRLRCLHDAPDTCPSGPCGYSTEWHAWRFRRGLRDWVGKPEEGNGSRPAAILAEEVEA